MNKILASRKRTTTGLYNGEIYEATIEAVYSQYEGNSQPQFSITVENAWIQRQGYKQHYGCGCMHELVKALLPEWGELVKWHLVGPKGPMHYISNALWHASDKDCWGWKHGEQKRERDSGKPLWYIYAEGAAGYIEGESSEEALDNYLNRIRQRARVDPLLGEGKEPNFDHFRSTAVWPEITDEQIIELRDSGKLQAALEDRLPALVAEFRKDMWEFFGVEFPDETA